MITIFLLCVGNVFTTGWVLRRELQNDMVLLARARAVLGSSDTSNQKFTDFHNDPFH